VQGSVSQSTGWNWTTVSKLSVYTNEIAVGAKKQHSNAQIEIFPSINSHAVEQVTNHIRFAASKEIFCVVLKTQLIKLANL